MPKVEIETRRIKPGKYQITRKDDGRVFNVLKGLNGRWVIEAADTLKLDDAPTLRCAQADIANRWTPLSREAPASGGQLAWERAMGMGGYVGSPAWAEARKS